MDDRSEVPDGQVRHALVCRDALDGRVSIEDQVYCGDTLAGTTLVATVAPDDAKGALEACRTRLDETGSAVPAS